ncbi:translation initiation factor [Jeongeupia sp. HS-3]|uniref:stress response translation initiation inhibitor YciH n=1 Tax=Jeongeupia sp. HS-3 TaxID=1009682 RepID=UPI0018A53840|nr:stress response translation initiation inhibitor YciH [Jeongeupia sp. HS-3]BCL77091.1 translation initiation factor [Jeongeupia sp. HS-3]
MKAQSSGGLVYSTEHGSICPACRNPQASCSCKAVVPAGFADGALRVSRETRKGKGVTLIKGLTLDAAALALLGKQLRTQCGSGGTVKDGVIEIQGDHCELVMAALRQLGHTVKRAGG